VSVIDILFKKLPSDEVDKIKRAFI